jgi:hypothetical protein
MADYAGSEKAFSPAIFGSDGYRREVGPHQPGASQTLGDVVEPARPDIRDEPMLPRREP